MRQNIDVVIQEALRRAFLPFFEDAERLANRLEDREKYIDELVCENNKLRHYHEDSGLERDKPKCCKYKLRKITKGQFAGQTDTIWFCPVCGMSVSNWEHYCVSCGQKLERKYLPDLEVKEDDEG